MKIGTKIALGMLILEVLALLSMWLIQAKGQKTQNAAMGNNSKLVQVGDNFKGNINVTYYDNEESIREIDRLKEDDQLRKEINAPFSNRPKVLVADPTVSFVNYTEDIAQGLVKALFDIKFLNIGGVEAKDIVTRWKIIDNGFPVTGLNEWLTKYLKQKPLIIKNLEPNRIVSLMYNPDIGAGGAGTLELVLEYEYTDPKSGKKYSDKFDGFIDYKTEKNNKSKIYRFSPPLN